MSSDRLYSQFSNPKGNVQAYWNHTVVDQTYNGVVHQPIDRCTIQFSLPEEIKSPIYLYYRLTKFYQNHRRYVKSLSQQQLQGTRILQNSTNVNDCDPLLWDSQKQKYIYPCGLIANSQFNDTIYPDITLLNPAGGGAARNISFSDTGIAWSSDAALYGPTQYQLGSDGLYEVVPPPNWRLRYPDGNYTADAPPPNLNIDEAFQVWMRTAGLPTFSKLALRNDNASMPLGDYLLTIDDGTRSLLPAPSSPIADKEPQSSTSICTVAQRLLSSLLAPSWVGEIRSWGLPTLSLLASALSSV